MSKIELAKINDLKKTAQRIALLDAVIQQEWEYRYYSYNSHWSDNQEMASMRDGSGNNFFILFEDKKCFIKVIDKEIDNKEKIFQILEGIATEDKNQIIEFLNEPAFYVDELSFLYWNIKGFWEKIEIGTNNWLNILKNPVIEYKKFAEEYYEIEISSDIIEKILKEEITMSMLKEVNLDLDMDLLKENLEDIGIKIEKEEQRR